jgi:hypothetical protein
MRDPANNNAVRINNSNYNTNNYNRARELRVVNTNSNTNENNVGQARPRVINPNNLRRMRTARLRFVLGGRRLNFANNNNRPNTSNYIKNEKQMKTNANENAKTKKITWKKMSVNNLPSDPIKYENFKTGDKAVKINKLYLSPESFRQLARMSMTKALNTNGNQVLFKNPFTRGTVKKGDLKFVVLERAKKN